MENLTSCNLETIGTLVLICREKGYDIKYMFEKFYPKTIVQLNLNLDEWAKKWENKIITKTKKEYEELKNNGDCVMISSLNDKEYIEEKIKKINKIIAELN